MNLEQVKQILQENKYSIKEKKDVKFDYKLMENKLEFDTTLFELLALGFSNGDIIAKANQLEDLLNELYRIEVEIYESLDFYPHIYTSFELNEEDVLTQHRLVDKLVNILNEDVAVIYEKCARNKSKSKFEKTKSKMKQKLQETGNVEKTVEYIEKYNVLSEMIDRIVFSGINKKYVDNIENYIQENDMDKTLVEEMFRKYEDVKERIIDLILS
jgi:hypothetical protein